MKKPSKLLWVLIAGFSLLFLGIVLSKNFTRLQSLFISQDTLNERAKENPQFWYEATPVSSEDGLYLMENALFAGESYNDIYKLGDNLLLVGNDHLSTTIDTSGLSSHINTSFNGDSLSHFTFTIYSPWRNRILYSVSPEEMFYTDYQVVGEYVFLFRERDFSVDIYDKTLTKKGKFDLSGYFNEDAIPAFLPSGQTLCFYMCDDNNMLYYADFSDSIPAITPMDTDYAQYAFGNFDTDSMTAICSALNKRTLRYELLQIDLNDFSVKESLPGTYYPLGYTNQYGLLGATNISNFYWCIDSTSALPAYFQQPNSYPIGINAAGNFSFCVPSGNNVSFYSYNTEGDLQSCVDIPCDNYYLSYHKAYFADENVMFLLGYSQNLNPVIYIWEPKSNPSADDTLCLYPSELQLSYYADLLTADDNASEITLIPDVKNYDWEDLYTIQEKADALENAYGITIYLGPEVPKQIDCYHLKQECDPETITQSLDMLDEILAAYPSGFLDQLCYGENRSLHIYLSGAISSDADGMLDEPSAYVNSINSYMVMVLDTQYFWNWGYILNHEISHMIDRRLLFCNITLENTLFSEDDWATYNPSDFTYLDSYDGYESDVRYDKYRSYFVDSYGITFATEDRAELFGNAMWNALEGVNDQAIFAQDTPTRSKYEYYCKCIRDGFDTTKWESTPSWEQVLE